MAMALATNTSKDFFRGLLSSQPYKPGQGWFTRALTAGVLCVAVVAGVWTWLSVGNQSDPWTFGMIAPIVVGGLLAWVAYRATHFPRFADFLIQTEVEMMKVTWPGKADVQMATTVVIACILLMSAFLFVTDLFWKVVLKLIGALELDWLNPLG